MYHFVHAFLIQSFIRSFSSHHCSILYYVIHNAIFSMQLFTVVISQHTLHSGTCWEELQNISFYACFFSFVQSFIHSSYIFHFSPCIPQWGIQKSSDYCCNTRTHSAQWKSMKGNTSIYRLTLQFCLKLSFII